MFLLPSSASAAGVTCAQAGAKLGVAASCTTSCASTDINLTNTFAAESNVDAKSFCPGTQSCCATTGQAFCEGFTNTFNLQGQCRASVCNPSSGANAETEFPFNNQNICGSSGVCCVVGRATVTVQSAAALLGSAGGTTKSTTGNPPIGAPQVLPDPLGGVNIPTLIGNIVRTFTGIAGSLALLMFVYGGVMYILSGGEQAAVQKSKAILFNASIGIVLIFLAYLLTSTIINAMLAS